MLRIHLGRTALVTIIVGGILYAILMSDILVHVSEAIESWICSNIPELCRPQLPPGFWRQYADSIRRH